MSWLDKIQKDFTITLTVGNNLKTAKRVDYVPNWLNARRSVEYNIAEFNFKNQRGTLVKRGQPMGRRYALEIHFQGADNIDKATAFMADSEYPYPWQISHPMYGALYVQPISIDIDDRDYNDSKIICSVMETLGANTRPKINVDPVETIKAKQLSTDITTATAYEVAVPYAEATDISAMQTNAERFKIAATAFARTTADAVAAANAYSRALGRIESAASGTFQAIRSMQQLINLPASFANNINNRVSFLVGQFEALYDSFTTPRQKRLYENNAGTVLTTMCTATVTNITSSDYRSRGEVLQVADYIVNAWNSYVTNLDTISTPTNDTPDSYAPNFGGIFETSVLVKYTISNLLLLAENAAQQRIYRTEKDTNVILMAYKFYGLLPDDSTIQRVIDENNICLNEILQIKKGRDLVYYVGV